MRAPFRPRHLLLACVLLLAVLAHPALAAWAHDPLANVPIAPSTGDQALIQMISDGSGGAFLAFTDKRGGTEDLYL